MVKMKKINAIISGIASIFSNSNNVTDVFEKYPSTYEKDIEKSLQKAWLKVGNTLKGAIDKYGSEVKKSNV
jgi:hypothetical protein